MPSINPTIDEFNALTARVTALESGATGATGTNNTLLGHWVLLDGDGITLPDRSGHGNVGTFKGSPTRTTAGYLFVDAQFPDVHPIPPTPGWIDLAPGDGILSTWSGSTTVLYWVAPEVVEYPNPPGSGNAPPMTFFCKSDPPGIQVFNWRDAMCGRWRDEGGGTRADWDSPQGIGKGEMAWGMFVYDAVNGIGWSESRTGRGGNGTSWGYPMRNALSHSSIGAGVDYPGFTGVIAEIMVVPRALTSTDPEAAAFISKGPPTSGATGATGATGTSGLAVVPFPAPAPGAAVVAPQLP